MCDDLKLQRANRAENQVIITQRLEQLGCTFLTQLRQSFLQGLEAQRVLQHRATENLRREIRDACKPNFFTLREAVADIDRAVIVNTDNVTGVGRFRMLTIGCKERNRFGIFISLPERTCSVRTPFGTRRNRFA